MVVLGVSTFTVAESIPAGALAPINSDDWHPFPWSDGLTDSFRKQSIPVQLPGIASVAYSSLISPSDRKLGLLLKDGGKLSFQVV